MDVKIGDIVLTSRNELAVITEILPGRLKYPYLYQVKIGARTTYKGAPEDFKQIVGHVDLEALMRAAKQPEAVRRVSPFVAGLLPEELRGLKPDDTINVRHCGRILQARFIGYNPNRPKYPVDIRMNGRIYKAPLSMVVRENEE